MRMKLSLTLALIAATWGSAPANAQANFTATMIGITIASMSGDTSCLEGRSHQLSEKAQLKLSTQSEILLQNYLRLAGGGAAVDVRPLFTPQKVLAKKSSRIWSDDTRPIWSRDGQAGDVGAVDDPLARAFAASGAGFDQLVKLEQFSVAGDRFSTVGVWRVVAADDPNKVIGRYRIRVVRRGVQETLTWELLTLELIRGDAPTAKIVRYCSKPGDVEAYLAEKEKAKAEKEKAKAERARSKAQRPG